jgi:hypothetical protein
LSFVNRIAPQDQAARGTGAAIPPVLVAARRALLAAILRAHPSVREVLFDLP